MAAWLKEAQVALAEAPDSFGVLVDMRGLKLLSAESKVLLLDGQKRFKAAGMVRSALILDSMLLTLQFKSIAKETGIHAGERYFTASTPEVEERAVEWIVSAMDPDRKGSALKTGMNPLPALESPQ